jgi:hypothetical protein
MLTDVAHSLTIVEIQTSIVSKGVNSVGVYPNPTYPLTTVFNNLYPSQCRSIVNAHPLVTSYEEVARFVKFHDFLVVSSAAKSLNKNMFNTYIPPIPIDPQ